MRHIFFSTIIYLLSLSSWAQSPVADFQLPSSVCFGETFYLENQSTDFTKSYWNFCARDFDGETNVSFLEDLNGLGRVLGAKLYNFEGVWFGLLTSWNQNKLYLVEFSDGLSNKPTSIMDLGNPNGVLNQPVSVHITKRNGSIYGIIHNWSGTLVSVKFTNFQFGEFEDVFLLSSNAGGFPTKVDFHENDSTLLAVSIFKNGSTRILDFQNNLEDLVDPSRIYNFSSISGISDARDVELVNYNSDWYLFISDYNDSEVYLINAGQNLFEENILESRVLLEAGLEGRINNIEITNSWDGYYLHLLTLQGRIFKVKFLDPSSVVSLSDVIPYELQPNSLNEGYALTFSKDSSQVKGISFKDNNGTNPKLYGIFNKNQCNSSNTFSDKDNPNVSYSSSGTYPITLTAYHPNGNSASITKEITVTNNQAPDITFSTGENLCITNPITFNSTSAADITSYNWDFGDGNTSTAENPNHTYVGAGTYAVKLSVTDANGCNNSFQDSIRVFEEPVPDFQATAQGSICSQKPIIFENLTALPMDATFEWDLGDGSTSTVENPEHIYSEAGDYTVTQIIEMAGCLVERTKTITVNPGPAVAFQTANNCLGEILKFENTSQGEFLDSYQWDFGDGTQSTQANPNHSYDTAGVYNVQLTAFTTNGCDFTISQEVEIQPLALVNFDSEIACAGQPTQFMEQVNIEESNVTDYLWDFGVLGTQSDVSTEANPQFTYPAEGNYNVTLQVTTSDGCTSSGSQQIIVNSTPNATFEFEETCLGQTRLFSPVDTANSINHFWELQNNQGEILQTSQSTFFSYLFTEAGNYQLSYRQENENLCSQATIQTIDINEQPIPDFIWGTACVGEPVSFENLTALNGNRLKNYNWSIDGTMFSSDLAPQYIFEESGNYQLTLEVETQGGCIQNISKNLLVSSKPTAFFELEQSIGAYPFALNLMMQDDSNEEIVEVFWILNEDTISNSSELNHTITEPGTYLLGLTVINEAGCKNEYYEQVKVKEPSLEVSLSNLRIKKGQEFTSFILNISNRGSLVPERIDLAIDFGEYSLTESLEAQIYPEENRNFSLSTRLTDEQLRGLSKICISASPKSGERKDANPQNNRICTNLESGFKVMDIYPNPTVNQFTIPLIIPENEMIAISMEDSNGRQVKFYNYNLEAGYNEVQIQRENLSPGIYFLRFRYQGQEEIKKIIFQ